MDNLKLTALKTQLQQPLVKPRPLRLSESR